MKETTQDRNSQAKALGAKYAVTIQDTGKTLYLKEPSREVFKVWYATYSEDAPTANETVIKTLVVKEVSDMEVFDDYKSLASIFGQLSEIMALKKSSLVIL